MGPKAIDKWARNLAGKHVGDFTLVSFIGAGKIGYVYRAERRDFPDAVTAIKLTIDTLRAGWEVELKKVVRLGIIDGVVHYHHHDTATISNAGVSHLCQFTVWDYISPGENLRQHIARQKISTSFLLAVVERVLHVLNACEAKGVVRHGDLHSGNILIGDHTLAKLDDALQPRAPIYVSDFGYGATGGGMRPKDDYDGLLRIVNEMIPRIDYATATATHRRILQGLQRDFGKLLRERVGVDRRAPLELLQALNRIKVASQLGASLGGGNPSSIQSIPPFAVETAWTVRP